MKYALLIGINNYPDKSGFAPLKYAEQDACALSTALTEHFDFTTRVLCGQQAKRNAIEEAVAECGSGDTFLFFFAGHGQYIKGQYRLHPVDSQATGLRAIPFHDLAGEWQHGFGFSKVLAILDACRSELSPGRGGTALDPETARDINRTTRGRNLVEVIYGCSEGEVSYEDPDLGHGVFTHALLDVLHSHQGELDTGLLCGAAGDRMRAWCSEHGKGRVQEAYRYYRPSLEQRIVLRHGQPIEQQQNPVLSKTVLCPRCGCHNEKTATFCCKGCARDYLCLRHQNIQSFLCDECVAKIEKEQQRKEELARLRREGWTEPVTGMEFVWVPAGSFQMGDLFGDESPHEQPVHKVRLKGFWLGKYPVTQGQWQKVMGYNPSQFKKGDSYPVEQVSWHDCQEYINRLNQLSEEAFRLPSEAEWEYAARSGCKTKRYAGADNPDRVAWYEHNAEDSTHPVGELNPNGLGLYDMSGNVWEWVQDQWHFSYENAPTDGSDWKDKGTGTDRVFRGGCWWGSASNCRSALRERCSPDDCGDDLGFRLLRAE